MRIEMAAGIVVVVVAATTASPPLLPPLPLLLLLLLLLLSSFDSYGHVYMQSNKNATSNLSRVPSFSNELVYMRLFVLVFRYVYRVKRNS